MSRKNKHSKQRLKAQHKRGTQQPSAKGIKKYNNTWVMTPTGYKQYTGVKKRK